jgi:hypothetical protein
MDNPAPEMIERVHRLTLQALARVSADLTALEALASAEEAVPDRRESAELFHHSAQQGCVQLRRYVAALLDLARARRAMRTRFLAVEGGRTHRHRWCADVSMSDEQSVPAMPVRQLSLLELARRPPHSGKRAAVISQGPVAGDEPGEREGRI